MKETISYQIRSDELNEENSHVLFNIMELLHKVANRGKLFTCSFQQSIASEGGLADVHVIVNEKNPDFIDKDVTKRLITLLLTAYKKWQRNGSIKSSEYMGIIETVYIDGVSIMQHGLQYGLNVSEGSRISCKKDEGYTPEMKTEELFSDDDMTSNQTGEPSYVLFDSLLLLRSPDGELIQSLPKFKLSVGQQNYAIHPKYLKPQMDPSQYAGCQYPKEIQNIIMCALMDALTN